MDSGDPSLSSRKILKIKLSCPEKSQIVLLFYIKRYVNSPKFSICPVRETPKEQNCPVRPTFDKIVLLDRRPTRQPLVST